MDPLIASCQQLARVPTAVPLGPNTLMEPDDPLLLHYVQAVLRPEFENRGVERFIDASHNQFIAEFGNGDGPAILVMAYTVSQHNNLMGDPWSGAISIPYSRGVTEPCLFGQGVSQNKVHQAAVLDLAQWLDGRSFDGTLWLGINNEGRSSHQCTNSILDALPRRPDFALLLFPTGFDISVGNRGRVDIIVDIEGKACHSSTPEEGASAIDGAALAMERIRALNNRLRRDSAGSPSAREHAVVYQATYYPVAPHTLPGSARLVVDRRIISGSDPDATVNELAEELSGLNPFTVSVRRGVTMLPAVLEDTPAEILSLERAVRRIVKQEVVRFNYPGTFDAGGPMAHGIPTVMFGAEGEGDLLGDDFVKLSSIRKEALALREFITDAFSLD